MILPQYRASSQFRNNFFAHEFDCEQHPLMLQTESNSSGICILARAPSRSAPPVSDMMKALGDPQRIAILRLVHKSELPAGEIASHFNTTRQAVSQNLRVLTNAGLIELRQEGTRRFYRIRSEAFQNLRSFLDAFWDDRLSALKNEIEAKRRSKRD